jgi:hypothetical protein
MASRFVLNALMLTGGLSATFPNPAAAIPPVSVSVAPAAIAWDTNTWVDVTVSNLTVGSKLMLSLFVDLNRNGALDADDRRLLCFPLQDGVTNAIGSRVIPDDDDAAANGILRARLSYHAAPGGGASVIWKSVGTYFWKAESSAGSASGRFDVTQRVGNVWFAGRVVDYVTDAAIPGALVGLEAIAEHLALPSSWSDTNGNFMLNVPAGFATQKVSAVWAAGVNGITSDRGPNGEPFSSQILTGLAAGTNTLADPLYVLSDASIPGETFRVSGRVCDQNSNAVACAWINAEMRDEDADVWTVGLTDTNGNFSIPVVGNAEIGVEAMGDVVGLQGLMSGIAVLTVTSDVSGVAIYCPRATMLARVKVEAAAGGAPVVGADVFVGNDDGYGASYTLPDGTADVGVIPGSWYSALDEDSVRPLSYIPPDFLGPFTISPPGPFTNIAFRIEKGYTISGYVFNQATNALAGNMDGGVVTAFRHRSWDWVQDSMVGLSGYYEIFAPTGTFRVRTYDFDMQGYLDLSFTNYYAWEQYDNGDPAGDPVVVGTQNVTGVNFHLPPGASIEGHVYTDTGTPIANAQVRVHIQPEPYRWRTVGEASTDGEGAYWILVPPGSNYYVWANADGYAGQAYKDHFILLGDSDMVTTTVAVAATNIDFHLHQPSHIQGRVTSGGQPVTNVFVRAAHIRDPQNDWWDWQWFDWVPTDGDGYYTIDVPPGSNYVVFTVPSSDNFYVPECWSNTFDREQATLVSVALTSTVGNIDFDLVLGGRISGTIFESDGTTPINDAWASAVSADSGIWFDAQTPGDGTYSVNVPAGAYRVRAQANDRLAEYFDGIYETQWDSATIVTVAVAQALGPIDFQLDPASRIRGRISGGGTPVPGMGVFVDWMPDTNQWWATSRMGWGWSDSNGNYSIDVPPGTNYVVGTDPRGGSFYPARYWNDVAGAREATHVGVGPGGVLDGIDLDLAMGFRVEGRVTDENGAPMGNVDVAAHLLDGEGDWVRSGGMWTEQDGLFGFPLPTGTNYFLVARTTWDGSWCPRMFYDGKLTRETADWVETNAGEVVSGVDFQLFPGYRVEGHVYRSDGHTPIQDAYVASVDGDGNWSDNTSTDPAGAFGLAVATNRQLRLQAGGYELASEFFKDVYELNQATVLQLPPLVSTNLDFVLYNMNEDGDGDGVPDRDEDSRPDGRYTPAEDWASFTNRDTDGEGLDDGREWSLGTDPQKRDSDDDTQSDMEEVDVLGTDPLNSTSKLECRQVAGRSNLTTVTWSSVPGKTNYWIHRSTNLKLGPAGWSPARGPLSAAPGTDVTSAVVTNAPATTNAAFRVVVPY